MTADDMIGIMHELDEASNGGDIHFVFATCNDKPLHSKLVIQVGAEASVEVGLDDETAQIGGVEDETGDRYTLVFIQSKPSGSCKIITGEDNELA